MTGYERFDTEEPSKKSTATDDDPQPACCSDCIAQYNPRKDPVEFLSLLSLVSLSIGILLTMVGYLVPREYEFDPDLEAEQMEDIEIYYDKLSWHLDVCIIVGMAFVVLGGLILAGIITYLHVTSDFWAALCGDVDPEWDGPCSPCSSRDKNGSKTKIRKHVPGYQSTDSVPAPSEKPTSDSNISKGS